MYNERIQLLVSREQRRRLEQEARRRGTSVASVVRAAVDAALPGRTREQRLAALEQIKNMRDGVFLTPEEIDRLVGEEREANVPESIGKSPE